MLEKSAAPKNKSLSPWFWVPSLYYAEGIPYIVVMTISVIMYKRLGISNTDIALYTSWLYLPWVIKPIWSPVVDLFKTKRFWIITMQFLIGAGLACIALTLPLSNFFKYTLAIFWFMAFLSATHDIAADGFYMLGLNQRQQAWFVGIRSTFYRFAMLTGQGLLVILAGYLESHSGLETLYVQANAVKSSPLQQEILPPDSLDITPLEGELRLIAYPENVQIPIVLQDAAEIEALVNKAVEWNSSDKEESEQSIKSEETKRPGWWRRNIVVPIERVFLRALPPPERAVSTGRGVGNATVIYIYLSKEPDPGRKIVVNFGRQRGDKNISLVEGGRMAFTAENWNRPLMAVIQLDPKLKSSCEATFTGRAGNIPLSWSITFVFLAVLFGLFAIYHLFMIPKTSQDKPRKIENAKAFFKEFGNTFLLFFKRDKIGIALAFLLLYRLAESQLVKIATPFLLDPQEAGGLGLTTGEVGFVYGTVGLVMLTLGGIIGGFIAAKHGLKRWIWWMVLAINVPDIVYIYMAETQTNNFLIINICVGIEQFGYGFGFTAYMLYMIYISRGPYKTAHFALTTGFMALGMMLPGMMSGWLQELIGYPNFFKWVLLSTIPGIVLIKFLPLDPEFGKKESES